MKRDKLIFKLLDEEKQRQEEGIELIASENFVSKQVMEAAGSVATNKYAEGLPGKRYYGGCEVVDEIETIAIERAKQLFNAEWAGSEIITLIHLRICSHIKQPWKTTYKVLPSILLKRFKTGRRLVNCFGFITRI